MEQINRTKELFLRKEWCHVEARKTKFQYQTQIIYQATKKGNGLKKGDYFYLDNLHKNHVEVYTKTLNSRLVLNLDMTINVEKTKEAKSRVLKLRS